MNDARVLVVDDSAAMRALFADILEQTKGVTVVGMAVNADDARSQLDQVRPNVITLDVEMPGKSGIEFLQEIMEERPMPVVMLSSHTQSGTETSLRALELGAVECFPKPLKVSPEQFTKMAGKLGKIVLAAANSKVRDRPRASQAPVNTKPFSWNGSMVALSASMGGIDALTELFAHYPKDCPPTVTVLQAEPALVESFIRKMAASLPCAVKAVEDGAALEPGTIHIAYDPARHVVLEPGTPPKLRLLDRESVEGARPSATLLFGTIARAQLPAVGAVLTGLGKDGARGLKLLRDAGSATFAQSPDSAMVSEAPAEAIAQGAAELALDITPLSEAILEKCNKG